MKKKTNIIIFLIIIMIVITAIFLFTTKKIYSENYEKVLTKIKEGNQYIIKNDLTDGCFPYRYFHRGCYYDQSKSYLIISTLQDYGLTHREIIDLCYKFGHKGAVAYCLNMNAEKQKCYNFARDNDYLKRICNLKKGEWIPSKKFGPYKTDNFDFKVDSWDTIEVVKYSSKELN